MSTTPRQPPWNFPRLLPHWTLLPKRMWEPTGTRIVKDGDKERNIRTWSSREKTSEDYLDDELAREAVGL